VEKHSRVEVGNDVVEVEGRFGVERRNDTECGDDLEVLVTLVDEGKVASLCANTKV
jgi:hypothetical protein